jgi:NAD(P)H-dependent FMN reductase
LTIDRRALQHGIMADNPAEPCLLIAWHSRTGASASMARAAAEGAGAAAQLVEAGEATPDMLLAADGYIFCCPENLGSMSGAMKELFDRCYYPLLGQVEGRPYATIIAAGSDGLGAERQIDRIVTGWRLRRVADPLIVNFAAQTPEAIAAPKQVPAAVLDQCRDIGAALAEGLRIGVF